MWMTDSEIRTSYRQALNPKEQIKILAELNDCSKNRIEYILGLCDKLYPEVKMQYNGSGRRYGDDVKNAVLDYIRSGKSVLDAEQYFGILHYTIYQWCHSAGVTPNFSNNELRNQILADLNSGMSVKDAARKYKKSEGTIYKYCQDAGMTKYRKGSDL